MGWCVIDTSSVLDRLLRDAITMNQHAVAGPAMTEAAGQLTLGQQPTGRSPRSGEVTPDGSATGPGWWFWERPPCG